MAPSQPCPRGFERPEDPRDLRLAAELGINRRQFLRAGAVFALLVGVPWKAAGASSPKAVEIVAEVSHAEGQAFAAALSDRGSLARATGTDASLLVEEIGAALAQRPVALVGLTGTATAVLVEAVAHDRGLVLTYRGRHERTAGGVLRHGLDGDGEVVRHLGRRLSSSGAVWPQAFRRHLAHLLALPRPPTQLVIELPAPPTGGARGPLVSWAFVPGREA